MIAAVDKHAELSWLGRQTWFGWTRRRPDRAWCSPASRPPRDPQGRAAARFAARIRRTPTSSSPSIAGIVLTLLCWHAAATAAGLDDHAGFLSRALANAFPGGAPWERAFLWAHLCLIFGFLAYLPYSKHLHIATAAANVWMARTRARGRLEPLHFEVPEAELRFGVATVADLTRKQIVDAFSCTECGRCQDACPAARHREGAVAEAPDHGRARPAARAEPRADRRHPASPRR